MMVIMNIMMIYIFTVMIYTALSSEIFANFTAHCCVISQKAQYSSFPPEQP